MDRVGGGRRWAGADVVRRLALVVEATRQAALLVGEDGHILMTNRRAAALFGYAQDDLVDVHCNDLLADAWRPGNGQRPAMSAAITAPRALRKRMPTTARRKDGSPFSVTVGYTPIALDDVQVVLVSVHEDPGGSTAAGRPRGDRAVNDPDILDAVPFSVITTDPTGVVTSANRAATRLLGCRDDQLIGRPLALVDASAGCGPEALGRSLAASAGTERERDCLRADGTAVPVNEGITTLHSEDGTTAGYLVAAYDITKHRQAQAAVLFMADHDGLTNLPNRSMLVRHLASAIDRATADHNHTALVLLDLDHFKRVNDSMGHHAGDVLLLQVADRLKRGAPAADMVARLGGDEFVLLFTGVEDVATLTTHLSELLRELSAPMMVHGAELGITVSAGAVLCPRDADNPSSALRLADTAMYHAKSAGRNGFAWFAKPMLDDANDRTAMAADLRLAFRHHELSVAYQPQVDLVNGEILGFEALARWNGPKGPVPPDRFIPVAEESGMIGELGAWVLDRACQDVAAMSAELGRHLTVAVNCSPRQLHGPGLVETVRSALERSGLAPGQLELEITESVLMDERWNVHEVLSALRDQGIAIAVDDFGQGYSSLAYLTRFPIDALKIDRAFIERIQPAAPQAPIVDAVIGMAHALGLAVTAEGVESDQQANYLTSRGCERGQGFLYGRGMSVDDATALLRESDVGAVI